MNFDLAWLIWLGAVVLTFLILEGWALLCGGSTLSENVQRWMGVRPVKPWRPLAVAILLTGLAVLGKHLTGT